MKRLALIAALALCGPALANTVIANFPPNPGVLPGGGWEFSRNTTFADPVSTPRAWTNGTYGTPPTAGAQVSTTHNLTGPAGQQLQVQVKRNATNRAIGRAAARAVQSLPFISTGVLLWDVFNEVHVRPDEAGGLLLDERTDAAETPSVEYSVTGWDTWRSSRHEACVAVGPTIAAQAGGSFLGCELGGAGGTQVRVHYTGYCAGDPTSGPQNCSSFGTWRSTSQRATTSLTCPPSIDPLNPQYSIPGGGPPGPDGRCPTARYFHTPITPDAAGDLFRDAPPPDVGAVAEDAVSRGQGIEASPGGVSGPASQVGSPGTTTTTAADGTVTQVTKTPTYTFVYGGDTLTWNTTYQTITTITPPDGPPQTIIEDTTPSQPQPFDPEDPCTANPDRIGCSKFGEVPDAEPLQREDVPLTPQEVIFAGGGGSCPEGVPFTIYGQQYTLSYQGFCDVASWLRPIFLAIGAATAAFIFAAGFRV